MLNCIVSGGILQSKNLEVHSNTLPKKKNHLEPLPHNLTYRNNSFVTSYRSEFICINLTTYPIPFYGYVNLQQDIFYFMNYGRCNTYFELL